MIGKILLILLMLAPPVVVFKGGAWLMKKMSGRAHLIALLEESDAEPEDRKFLNMRLGGYSGEEVVKHWGLFKVDGKAVRSEKRFLELDLVFPFLYGAAMAASLLIAWAGLGRPFSPVWCVAPVALMVITDWIENLIQINQLNRFLSRGDVSESLISIASVSTSIKVACAYLFLGFLAILIALFFFGFGAKPRA